MLCLSTCKTSHDGPCLNELCPSALSHWPGLHALRCTITSQGWKPIEHTRNALTPQAALEDLY